MSWITGVGVDAVAVERIQRESESNEAFVVRAFTGRELAHCSGRQERLAGRWAAKEAVMKALGVGLGIVDPHDVEILATDAGQPRVELHRQAAVAAADAGVRMIHVSISHDDGQAVAFAVAEGGSS